MNRTELKDIVLQVLTPEEVAAFGDKRLTATWQKAYDSLTPEQLLVTLSGVTTESTEVTATIDGDFGISEMQNGVTVTQEEHTKESAPNNLHLLSSALLFVLHWVLVGYFLTEPHIKRLAKYVYRSAHNLSVTLADEISYKLHNLILDY